MPHVDYVAVIAMFSALVGYPALVAIIVNVLKSFSLVADGDAPRVVAGLNALGLIALLVARIFLPQLDISSVDAELEGVATFLTVVLGFVIQMGVAKGSHTAVKGLPLIGKSFSQS